MKNSITIVNGSEGDRNDPWSFTRYYFTNAKGQEAMCHVGLQVYFQLGNRRYTFYEGISRALNEVGLDAFDLLASFAGVSTKTFSKLCQREQEGKYYE